MIYFIIITVFNDVREYILSQSENESAYLNESFSRCSLLDMSIKDHQTGNKRLKFELLAMEVWKKRNKNWQIEILANMPLPKLSCVKCSALGIIIADLENYGQSVNSIIG